MDDNNEKFIIGDNTDGYRRTNADYDLDLFSDPKRNKKPTPDPAPPAKKGAPAKNRSGRPQSAQKNGFFGRKPSKPVPKKEGPSVTRYAKPPREAQARSNAAQPNRQQQRSGQRPPQRPDRRPPQRREQGNGGRVLSGNEQRREHAQMRRAQRRRRLIIQYAAIGLVVLVAVVVLSLTVFFRIDEIKIEGESPYTDEEIIAACGIALDENVITCDADGVSERLSKALPYIGSAQVKRSLNGKVVITVEVTPGCYSFELGENIVVVDSSGKVLEHKVEQPEENYTEIIGAELSAATPGEQVQLIDPSMFTLLSDIHTKLDDSGVSDISSINVGDVYEITIVYDERITLEVGDTTNLDRKLALASMVIERENELSPDQYGVIDLGSVEGKAFFRPVDPPEEPETETNEDATDVGQETPTADTAAADEQTTAEI